MNVNVKKIEKDESIIEVETRSEVKELVIERTEYGHRYKDFGEWDISDNQYDDLEELVDSITDQMSGKSSLNVSYDL